MSQNLCNSGIILKLIPEKDLCIILDSLHGKIPCRSKSKILLNGLEISYFLNKKKDYFFLEKITIENNPFEVAKENLFFLHHILELTNFFSPLEKPNEEIYNILNFFLKYYPKFQSKIKQKIFLCKFFSLLGIYPDMKQISYNIFEFIISPIDIVVDIEIDLNIERILDLWINYGIETHPYYKKLNTRRFL